MDIKEAHKHSSNHRKAITQSKECGCFCCLNTYPPKEIWEWIDSNETAMCPRCGIDSVLPDSIGFDKEFLIEMNKYWFDRSPWCQRPKNF